MIIGYIAGKTTLLYTWCLSDQATKAGPTYSFNVEMVYGPKNGQILLVWDVTDTVRRRQFYHGTDGKFLLINRHIYRMIEKKSDASTNAGKPVTSCITFARSQPAIHSLMIGPIAIVDYDVLCG